jgi:hypothetical protein
MKITQSGSIWSRTFSRFMKSMRPVRSLRAKFYEERNCCLFWEAATPHPPPP